MILKILNLPLKMGNQFIFWLHKVNFELIVSLFKLIIFQFFHPLFQRSPKLLLLVFKILYSVRVVHGYWMHIPRSPLFCQGGLFNIFNFGRDIQIFVQNNFLVWVKIHFLLITLLFKIINLSQQCCIFPFNEVYFVLWKLLFVNVFVKLLV